MAHRGNKLFGDTGSHGESLVPPWPSVAAGALRSRMLADDGVDMTATLWSIDHRVGVGLDATSGRAADGRLFSVQAVAMVTQGQRIGANRETDKPVLADYDVGFIATVGAAASPTGGSLRLGGDGRAAALSPAASRLPPDFDAIARARGFRTFRNLRTIAYLLKGGLDLPGSPFTPAIARSRG